MNTVPTNPADCDRTTVYTGECRNFADTEWIRFDSGRRRDAGDGNTWLVDVAYGSFWMADDKVRNLVPLVPGRDFSGVDWKTMYDQARASLHEACKVAQSYKVDAYQATERAEAAERERDEEKAARREAWKHLHRAADRVVHEQIRAQDAECERDEWKARAEKANRVGDDMIRQAQTEMMRALGRADRAEARVRELEADERLAAHQANCEEARDGVDR